uniref:Uncharacterized protein n=1 Tax=Ixodes ricinus TaxID=34613 RepID=A0A6B0V757_IXORI
MLFSLPPSRKVTIFAASFWTSQRHFAWGDDHSLRGTACRVERAHPCHSARTWVALANASLHRDVDGNLQVRVAHELLELLAAGTDVCGQPLLHSALVIYLRELLGDVPVQCFHIHQQLSCGVDELVHMQRVRPVVGHQVLVEPALDARICENLLQLCHDVGQVQDRNVKVAPRKVGCRGHGTGPWVDVQWYASIVANGLCNVVACLCCQACSFYDGLEAQSQTREGHGQELAQHRKVVKPLPSGEGNAPERACMLCVFHEDAVPCFVVADVERSWCEHLINLRGPFERAGDPDIREHSQVFVPQILFESEL